MKEFNKKSLGWLFGFTKGLAEALKSNRRFYPIDDDIDKLKQLYKQLISQSERQVDEEYIEEKATSFVKELARRGGTISMNIAQDFLYQFASEIEEEKKAISMNFIQDFIRSILQEIQKPRKEGK